MPSQPSSSVATGIESVRLAHVFVRIPSGDSQDVKPATAVRGQKINRMKGNEMPSAPEHQHALPPTPTPPQEEEEEEEEPSTPQKQPATKPTLSTHLLPPTPSPTPAKNPLKRPLHHHPSPQTSPLKRPRTANNNNNSNNNHPSPLPRFHRPPKFSLAYSTHHHHHHSSPPPTPTPSPPSPTNPAKGATTGISSQELQRAAESVMRQVDWAEVVLHVAGNRSRGAYKRAVRRVLQEGVEEIARLEGWGAAEVGG